MPGVWRRFSPPCDNGTVSVLLEFVEFISGGPQPAVDDLLHRVLVKSRKLTGAEAGSIFIVRERGRKKTLEIANVQNDVVAVPQDLLKLPADANSVVGYVARTGERVRLDDVYKIPADKPYNSIPTPTGPPASARAPSSASRSRTTPRK